MCFRIIIDTSVLTEKSVSFLSQCDLLPKFRSIKILYQVFHNYDNFRNFHAAMDYSIKTITINHPNIKSSFCLKRVTLKSCKKIIMNLIS